jgi:DNA-binding response OmpR family regulator
MPANRILLADDDTELGKILQTEFTSYGYQIDYVENGEEAISHIKQNPCDLAILDIRMPLIDGFEVLKFIKKEKPSIKVIMLTAYSDLKNLVISMRDGADRFIGKPYNLEELRYAVEELLR